MITMTEFIEKVDAIMGQQVDDTKANQLCRLYAMIYDRGKNSGHNICVAKACNWLERNYHATPMGGYYYLPEDCIEQFKQAMKGE